MTPEQRDILANFRAKRIDYGTAYTLLVYFEHPAPHLALHPPITTPKPQGWEAVYAPTGA